MSRHDYSHENSLERFIDILSALVAFILIAAVITWAVVTTPR